jgi:hypothetical protein
VTRADKERQNKIVTAKPRLTHKSAKRFIFSQAARAMG